MYPSVNHHGISASRPFGSTDPRFGLWVATMAGFCEIPMGWTHVLRWTNLNELVNWGGITMVYWTIFLLDFGQSVISKISKMGWAQSWGFGILLVCSFWSPMSCKKSSALRGFLVLDLLGARWDQLCSFNVGTLLRLAVRATLAEICSKWRISQVSWGLNLEISSTWRIWEKSEVSWD